ncbi:MAG TPA: carboxypeptidase-like regulatory domain-containing protein [Candidatus Acidoferrum sp.]|nr:carboxypeptidase-like regulatory domain-containing protein [Candidatus Acidoferrum sp.]
MRFRSQGARRFLVRHVPLIFASCALLAVFGIGHPAIVLATEHIQSDSKKDEPPPTTKIKIEVSDPSGKPVGQASVYVRFNQPGGTFHKDKLAELDLKTNDNGSTKVPPIPQGRIMIQVIAKGWRTYGQWYDIESDEQTVQIKLQAPPHWY